MIQLTYLTDRCQNITEPEEPRMKMGTRALMLVIVLGSQPGISLADQDDDAVMTSCAQEAETYCSQVSLGEGRLLACFYAHEDRLSDHCQHVLYKAMKLLEAEIDALSFLADECLEDIVKFCEDRPAGEGRIARCLGYHSAELSNKCSTAIERITAD